MRVKEFIEKANELIEDLDLACLGDFYEHFAYWYEDEFKELRKVAGYQDVEMHFDYDIATDIYMLEDGFVGIRGGARLFHHFGEIHGWDEKPVKITVCEYEAVPSIAYKPKILN